MALVHSTTHILSSATKLYSLNDCQDARWLQNPAARVADVQRYLDAGLKNRAVRQAAKKLGLRP